MLKIAFRSDASLLIGKGHIMRCLTLADEIKTHQDDADITFITTPHTGNLDEFIVTQGYKVTSLPPPLVNLDKNNTATWLGCTQQEDATACQAKLTQHYDIIITDHYAIDIKWHRLIRPYCHNIMVIDDLANRDHDCDILLDQTLSRSKLDYKKLTPTTSLILTGETYTLLRKEFAKARIKAQQKRQKLSMLPNAFHVLITLGGFDTDNISQIAISALKALHNESVVFTATVILSSHSAHLADIKNTVNTLSWLTLELDCTTMSEQMLKADIAIGASGATSWERCCLGLPTISIQTADNQKMVSHSIKNKGAAINLGTYSNISASLIKDTLNRLLFDNNIKYTEMIKQCFEVCDGKGAHRVYRNILALGVTLRDAAIDDLDLIFSWQSSPKIRQYFRNNKPVTYDEHYQWFKKAIVDRNHHFHIISYFNNSVGLIRLDSHKNNYVEVSILISVEFQGKSLADLALNKIIKQYNKKVFYAYVDTNNVASHKLFTKAGFTKIDENNYRLYPSSISTKQRNS